MYRIDVRKFAQVLDSLRVEVCKLVRNDKMRGEEYMTAIIGAVQRACNISMSRRRSRIANTPLLVGIKNCEIKKKLSACKKISAKNKR